MRMWEQGGAAGAGARDEQVILVDADDDEIGISPKLRAHETGELHRAVSVFVFDADGRVLLQRRAAGKYHSAGLWSNTCCGHPRPGETARAAALRRLREEMGVECALEPRGSFSYRAILGNGLVEHEIDHLFVGTFQGSPAPDASEVAEWRWMDLNDVLEGCLDGQRQPRRELLAPS